MSYYEELAGKAIETISEFGDFEKFAIDEHKNDNAYMAA